MVCFMVEHDIFCVYAHKLVSMVIMLNFQIRRSILSSSLLLISTTLALHATELKLSEEYDGGDNDSLEDSKVPSQQPLGIGYSQEATFVLDEATITKLKHLLKNPFMEPMISLGDFDTINSPIEEQQIARIGCIVTDRMKKLTYDRMGIITAFLRHFNRLAKENKKIQPLEAMATFKPPIEEESGPACLGLTVDILKHLPKEIKSYIVPSKLHAKAHQFGFPRVGHTAVVIPYYISHNSNEKGYILLDPSFEIAYPVVLTPEKRNVEVFLDARKCIWEFELFEDHILCRTDQEDLDNPTTHMVYYLKHFRNPIQFGLIPMLLANRKYVLLSRDKKGLLQARIKIEMNEQKVVSTYLGVRKRPVAFFEILSSEEMLFDKEMSDALLHTPASLNQYIRYIVAHYSILDRMYIEYLKMLVTTSVKKST